MREDLCKPCAVEKSQKGYRLTPCPGRTDKITCDGCGRRRFGRTYEVQEAKKQGGTT